MSDILTPQILETMGTNYAILGMDRYSLLVRFRICGEVVECSVPTWCGLSDSPENIKEFTLVVVKNSETEFSWIFVRGAGRIIENEKWEFLIPTEHGLVDPKDLYNILRIVPKRMELFDEKRGWGFRETTDFIIYED